MTSYHLCSAPDCRFCGRHIEEPTHHSCCDPSHVKQDTYDYHSPVSLFLVLDVPSILADAESLRPGHTCQEPATLIAFGPGYNVISHGTNLHFPIEFDDGVKWMVRIRLGSGGNVLDSMSFQQQASEAATFNLLHSRGLPVPEAWISRVHDTNPAHPLYYSVDFVQGNYHDPMIDTTPRDPDSIVRAIIYNYAKFQISLEKITFDSVGSLQVDETGNTTVGPLMTMRQHSAEPPFFLGPFKSAKQAYIAQFERQMELVKEGDWCRPSRVLDTYCNLLELKDLVQGCQELEDGPFYLQHAEPRGDHILVNDVGDIKGIIDWEWSYTTSKAVAFASPIFCLDVRWFDYSNDLSSRDRVLMEVYEELGRSDLADHVRRGKKFQRLEDNMSGGTGWQSMAAMTRAFMKQDEDATGVPKSKEEWMKGIVERHAGDVFLGKHLHRP